MALSKGDKMPKMQRMHPFCVFRTNLFRAVASLCFECLKTSVRLRRQFVVSYCLHLMNTQNKKGGRPPKEADQKLKYRVVFRLSTAHYYRLIAQAKRAGVSPAEAARCATIGLEVRARMSLEQMALLRSLASMANNLNQLAVKAHSTAGYGGVAAECGELLEKIRSVLKQARQW